MLYGKQEIFKIFSPKRQNRICFISHLKKNGIVIKIDFGKQDEILALGGMKILISKRKKNQETINTIFKVVNLRGTFY